jgi:hypothetical protein
MTCSYSALVALVPVLLLPGRRRWIVTLEIDELNEMNCIFFTLWASITRRTHRHNDNPGRMLGRGLAWAMRFGMKPAAWSCAPLCFLYVLSGRLVVRRRTPEATRACMPLPDPTLERACTALCLLQSRACDSGSQLVPAPTFPSYPAASGCDHDDIIPDLYV